MQIEEKPAFSTPFEWIGGEDKVRALVERFYDLMDLEPGYAALRAAHGDTLDNARQRLFWFLCGWLGGPAHYTDRFGHPRLRARHMPFSIGIQERDQWLACMDQAMAETGVPGPAHTAQGHLLPDRRLDAQPRRLTCACRVNWVPAAPATPRHRHPAGGPAHRPAPGFSVSASCAPWA